MNEVDLYSYQTAFTQVVSGNFYVWLEWRKSCPTELYFGKKTNVPNGNNVSRARSNTEIVLEAFFSLRSGEFLTEGLNRTYAECSPAQGQRNPLSTIASFYLILTADFQHENTAKVFTLLFCFLLYFLVCSVDKQKESKASLKYMREKKLSVVAAEN